MHRARASWSLDRLGKSPDGERSPRCFLSLGGYTGCRGPARGRYEEAHLFDGLGGAGVMELRRPVRGADDQGDPGVVRLDHCGM